MRAPTLPSKQWSLGSLKIRCLSHTGLRLQLFSRVAYEVWIVAVHSRAAETGHDSCAPRTGSLDWALTFHGHGGSVK